MFEKYTEKARRVVFYARYEAAQLGSPYIEPEHILLGCLRVDHALRDRLKANVEDLRKSMEAKGPVSTSVDLPLANSSKIVLAHAYEMSAKRKEDHISHLHIAFCALEELNRHPDPDVVFSVPPRPSPLGIDARVGPELAAPGEALSHPKPSEFLAASATKRLERMLVEDHATKAEFDALKRQVSDIAATHGVKFGYQHECRLDQLERKRPAPFTGQEVSQMFSAAIRVNLAEDGRMTGPNGYDCTAIAEAINKRLGIL
jgi:hypothetical protein